MREESVGGWGKRLLEALSSLEDPRHPRGARHPLPAIRPRRFAPCWASPAVCIPSPCGSQDDCKVFSNPFMASLSNHRWLERASFDKLRMSRRQWAASLCNRPAVGAGTSPDCPFIGFQIPSLVGYWRNRKASALRQYSNDPVGNCSDLRGSE